MIFFTFYWVLFFYISCYFLRNSEIQVSLNKHFTFI
ncbi:unnamed protein product [Phytomonas sp. EM1]|nr:unnamed protein product [Phytomonas sp. EM1]|eukprot:CCW61514.1 unnamed protein product [Phytomonas sp. isolate EM1]